MHCPQIGYTWKPRWKLWVLFQDVILTGIGILLTSYFWMQRIHVGTSVETCWNHGIQCKFHYTSAAIWMLNSFKKSTIIELSIHWWLMNHSWYFAESTCSKLNTHIDIENKKGFPFSMISFLPFLRIYISQLAGLLLVYVCIYIFYSQYHLIWMNHNTSLAWKQFGYFGIATQISWILLLCTWLVTQIFSSPP